MSAVRSASTLVEVAISRAAPLHDQLFTYKVPADFAQTIAIGHRVIVPLGPRIAAGYVVGFAHRAPVPDRMMKSVFAIAYPQPFFTEAQVALARWISESYLAFMISCLMLFLPPGYLDDERRAIKEYRRNPSGFLEKGKAGSSEPEKDDIEKDDEAIELEEPRPPTAAQKKAIATIVTDLRNKSITPILLQGVTGSGKTEVYLQAIADIRLRGEGAIVLVPEVALTPQLVGRFKTRFGSQVALLHSAMSLRDRQTMWRRIQTGEIQIVLGTRSALFAPVKKLGLIVLDEEFEFTYKQERSPKYHARDAAIRRGEIENALVILGTATPSLESYHAVLEGRYKKLELPDRIDNHPLPPIEIVDMRLERKGKQAHILSPLLRKEMAAALKRKEQIILLQNRRGFSTYVYCPECGDPIQCPLCSVSFVYHSKSKLLKCRHCGETREMPVVCDKCQSLAVKYAGTGTQKVELEMRKEYPHAAILRLDRDVAEEGQTEKILHAFATEKADVLLGTQMVAKGLDFARVGVVGVVNADTSLAIPDFRSAERTYQLLTQAAGRAGRHGLPAKVILQTSRAEHYAIQAAAKYREQDFYEMELEFRKMAFYPPYGHLVDLMLESASEKKLEEEAAKFDEILRAAIKKASQKSGPAPDDIILLGPAPAAPYKVRGKYRLEWLAKGKDRKALVSALRGPVLAFKYSKTLSLSVDVDPV